MKEYLRPVSKAVCAHREVLSDGVLGKQISIFQQEDQFPEVPNFKFALLGVPEHRRDEDFMGETIEFDAIRMAFYSLYPGNWQWSMVDLGDVIPGSSISDTDFALREVVQQLLILGVMPIVLGGSQDLLYAHYRGFDGVHDMISVVNIDHRFDLGDHQKPMTNKAYVGKMVVERPYNLMNYSVLGYQSYLNPPEEISLMDKLHFDAYRLGNLIQDITLVEPVMRQAQLVAMDVSSIKSSAMSFRYHKSPNGFDSREICALSRYAGISDGVKSFGIYELKSFEKHESAPNLVAQILWYFIEGVCFRINDGDLMNPDNFTLYSVPINDMVLVFRKGKRTGRWWIEMPINDSLNNNMQTTALLPCTYEDYLSATEQNIPERWLKARLRNKV